MATKVRVGDTVTLPSGLVVPITVAADPARPWAAIEVTHLWHVCRDHGHEQPGVSHYFGGRPHLLQLDEADARALAAALNRARAAA